MQLHCERAYITEGRGGTKFHNIPEYKKCLYNYYLYISMRTLTMTIFRSHTTKINNKLVWTSFFAWIISISTINFTTTLTCFYILQIHYRKLWTSTEFFKHNPYKRGSPIGKFSNRRSTWFYATDQTESISLVLYSSTQP